MDSVQDDIDPQEIDDNGNDASPVVMEPIIDDPDDSTCIPSGPDKPFMSAQGRLLSSVAETMFHHRLTNVCAKVFDHHLVAKRLGFYDGFYELRTFTGRWLLPQKRQIFRLVFVFANGQRPRQMAVCVRHYLEFGRFFTEVSAKAALQLLLDTWGYGAYGNEAPKFPGVSLPQSMRNGRLRPGDHVTGVRWEGCHHTFLQHHGIYVDKVGDKEDQVVHFFNTASGAIKSLKEVQSVATIRHDPLSLFKGHSTCVFRFAIDPKSSPRSRKGSIVAAAALASLEPKSVKVRYHVFSFNCEHAAMYWTTGTARSDQTHRHFADSYYQRRL